MPLTPTVPASPGCRMDRPLTLASEPSDTGRTMSTETSDPPMVSSASVFATCR
jgi:hypothetical protein